MNKQPCGLGVLEMKFPSMLFSWFIMAILKHTQDLRLIKNRSMFKTKIRLVTKTLKVHLKIKYYIIELKYIVLNFSFLN